MKKFIIRSNYEYEIEANSKVEAIEKWNEIIEEELGTQNATLTTEFVESLYAEEIKEGR